MYVEHLLDASYSRGWGDVVLSGILRSPLLGRQRLLFLLGR